MQVCLQSWEKKIRSCPGEALEGFTKDGMPLEANRIQLAKIAATISGRALAKNITRFEIEDRQALFDIALLAVMQSPAGLSRHVHRFQILDPEKRRVVAFAAAIKCKRALARHIHRYHLPMPYLQEIADSFIKLKAPYLHYLHTVRHEPFRFALACATAVSNGEQIADHIEQFSLQNEKQRCALLELIIEQNPAVAALQFHRFGVERGMLVRRIAKKLLSRLGITLFVYAQFIEHHPLKAMLALESASIYPLETACSFGKFALKDPKDVLAIASLIYFIGKKKLLNNLFIIVDPLFLQSFAKITAYDDPVALISHLDQFHRQNLEDLALIAAEENALAVAKALRKFHIENLKTIHAIAKLLCQQQKERLLPHLKDIDDHRLRTLATIIYERNNPGKSDAHCEFQPLVE